MRTIPCGLMVLTLAGCGIDETVYIPEFANLYCQRTLDCEAEDVLVFDGFATLDDCLAVVGPQVEADVGRCDFSGRNARKCLDAFDQMSTCWPEDSTLDENLPPECAEVLSNCALGDPATTQEVTETKSTTPGGTGA